MKNKIQHEWFTIFVMDSPLFFAQTPSPTNNSFRSDFVQDGAWPVPFCFLLLPGLTIAQIAYYKLFHFIQFRYSQV